MSKLIAQIIAGIFTLRLAHLFLPGVLFEGDLTALIVAGLFLGLLNFFIKPVLKLLTLPLQILTLGLFSFIINIVIVYLLDLAFYELIFNGFWPMASFVVLLWLINLLLSSILD
jgi:putative membrane protein